MDYNAAAQAAQAQGNAQAAYFKSKADTYTGDYNNYKGQADAANQNVSSFNDYMKGAGSASNLYNSAFNDQAAKAGYSQSALNQAQSNVSQATGAQSAYNDYANTAASKWGMNAGALAASNAGAQSSLNNNIAAASTTLGNQQKALGIAQNGASQIAGLGVNQQQTQLSGLQSVYNNAVAQEKQASDNMNFYNDLYQKQGGLTAQQVQLFASSAALKRQADAAMVSAQAAMTQAQAVSRLDNAQVDIANEKNSYARANGIGDYAKTPVQASQVAAQQASGNGGSFNMGDWANGVLNPIGQGAQAAGRNFGNWAGDVAHNLHLFGA